MDRKAKDLDIQQEIVPFGASGTAGGMNKHVVHP